jgi:hypothetical protein
MPFFRFEVPATALAWVAFFSPKWNQLGVKKLR